MADYREEFYSARWHLDVAKRMFRSYDEYGGKRFLVGVIREAAKASANLVRAFLIREKMSGDLRTFVDRIASKYLDSDDVESMVKILEVERAHRMSKSEFARKDEILFEDDGNWKILKISRLREFIESIDDIIGKFPADIKR